MRGFTLIEVLIAVLLLIVGIVGVMAMFPLGAQTTKSAQMSSQAMGLAQAKMEELLAKSYDDPQLAIGTTTEEYGTIADFAFYKRVGKVACVHRADLSEVGCDYDLVSDPAPMKKVTVSVYWKSQLGALEKSVELASLMTKK